MTRDERRTQHLLYPQYSRNVKAIVVGVGERRVIGSSTGPNLNRQPRSDQSHGVAAGRFSYGGSE